jgi:hypothetical protein
VTDVRPWLLVARIEPGVTTVFAPPSDQRSPVEAAAIDAIMVRPYLTPKYYFQRALEHLGIRALK